MFFIAKKKGVYLNVVQLTRLIKDFDNFTVLHPA